MIPMSCLNVTDLYLQTMNFMQQGADHTPERGQYSLSNICAQVAYPEHFALQLDWLADDLPMVFSTALKRITSNEQLRRHYTCGDQLYSAIQELKARPFKSVHLLEETWASYNVQLVPTDGDYTVEIASFIYDADLFGSWDVYMELCFQYVLMHVLCTELKKETGVVTFFPGKLIALFGQIKVTDSEYKFICDSIQQYQKDFGRESSDWMRQLTMEQPEEISLPYGSLVSLVENVLRGGTLNLRTEDDITQAPKSVCLLPSLNVSQAREDAYHLIMKSGISGMLATNLHRWLDTRFPNEN